MIPSSNDLSLLYVRNVPEILTGSKHEIIVGGLVPIRSGVFLFKRCSA